MNSLSAHLAPEISDLPLESTLAANFLETSPKRIESSITTLLKLFFIHGV
jgi:hypothetical protein